METIKIEDQRSKFYEDLYEELYSNHGYHSAESWESTHYGGLIQGVIKPSGIEFDSLLDIGCSFGMGLEYYKEQGKEVYGIDVSKTAIERAKKRGFNCKVGSVTNIPYPDNFVDLVMSVETIEHIKPEDQEQAFKEMFRVSKKYIAHQISAVPESNTFAGKTLHLTCWNQSKWNTFIENLNLDWDIIYTLNEENWEKCKHNVYSNKDPKTYSNLNKFDTAYYKNGMTPSFESRIIYAVYLVMKKRNIKSEV